MLRLTAAVALAALATSIAGAQEPAPRPAAPPVESPAAKNQTINAVLPPDEAAMKSHVMFLASDPMKGREAGTPEYDIAAHYVASQFYAQGLRPAGTDGSFLQTVPLISYKSVDKGSVTIERKGAEPVSLSFGEEYLPGADPTKAATEVSAPVVFVGYGVVAPQFKRDDYKGVDVKGKIVAYFNGAPAAFPGEERAHFGNNANKAVEAAKRGAVGVITIESPTQAKVRPFTSYLASWDHARMTWANADGSGHLPAGPGTPGLAALSMAGAAKLFAGAKTPWSAVVARAEKPGASIKPFLLPATLSVALKTEAKPVTSYNVAGVIPGSDPVLKDQYVVLTAHLDHVGVGKADAKGDTIYNGAMDNAVGIASLIEEARRFKESGTPPKRSVMFLAVTAEEKGLVGADYFAHNPSVPKAGIVANVNLDMPVLTYKFEDMIAFGADRTSLGPIVRDAVAALGVEMGQDPMPEQGFFTRSDHYRFVQQGVPSVFLWPGLKGAGKDAFNAFLGTHYHKPSDEVSLPIDWTSGVRFIQANYQIARGIADMPERPAWNKGDFFGTLYNGYGAK